MLQFWKTACLALTLIRRYANAWYNKSLDLYQYKCEEVIKCFDKVLKLEPNYTGSWMNNGVVFLRLNIAKGGVLRCYSRATEINPKEARAWYIIGLIIDDQ